VPAGPNPDGTWAFIWLMEKHFYEMAQTDW